HLHAQGVFGNGKTYYGNFGPDSSYEVVLVRLSDRELRLLSWHDLYADNPKVVVTSRGVEALEGRDRDAVIASEPEEYKRFLLVWSEIRSAVRSWQPASGKAFSGTVPEDGWLK